MPSDGGSGSRAVTFKELDFLRETPNRYQVQRVG
jgi:hypothetical protein